MVKHIGKQLFHWAVIIICAAVFVSLITGYASAADAVTTPAITLQSAMADIITQATTGVKAGVAFLQQEIPDVVRQLLLWKAVMASVWALVYAGLTVVGIVSLSKAIAAIYEQLELERRQEVSEAGYEALSRGHDDYKEKYRLYEVAKAEAGAHVGKVIIRCILGVVLTIAGIVAFCNIWGHVLTVVQIYLAPKVWLIEYAASLVK